MNFFKKHFLVKDLLWIFVYPLYQTIGTIRHEGAHALAAMAEGLNVTEFVFWPSYGLGEFSWGYVRYSGYGSWFTAAAPYIFDLITFLFFYWILRRYKIKQRWLWLNLLIIGILSPLVNSAYSFMVGIEPFSWNDVGDILSDVPAPLVALYFMSTIYLYSYTLLRLVKGSRPA